MEWDMTDWITHVKHSEGLVSVGGKEYAKRYLTRWNSCIKRLGCTTLKTSNCGEVLKLHYEFCNSEGVVVGKLFVTRRIHKVRKVKKGHSLYRKDLIAQATKIMLALNRFDS